MTLRIYGDSFSVNLKKDWQYINQFTDYLQTDQYNNSLWGCANEWIIHCLMHDLRFEKFKKEDVVLIVPTGENRNWLFKDIPDSANFLYIKDLHKLHPPHELQAVKSYINYFHDFGKDVHRYFANFRLLESIKTAIQSEFGARVLIMPGFAPPTMTNQEHFWMHKYLYPDMQTIGNLNNWVCQLEFETQAAANKWYAPMYPDLRANHILKRNHNHLFDKLRTWYEQDSKIDLTTGFELGLITERKQHDFWDYQEEVVPLKEVKQMMQMSDVIRESVQKNMMDDNSKYTVPSVQKMPDEESKKTMIIRYE